MTSPRVNLSPSHKEPGSWFLWCQFLRGEALGKTVRTRDTSQIPCSAVTGYEAVMGLGNGCWAIDVQNQHFCFLTLWTLLQDDHIPLRCNHYPLCFTQWFSVSNEIMYVKVLYKWSNVHMGTFLILSITIWPHLLILGAFRVICQWCPIKGLLCNSFASSFTMYYLLSWFPRLETLPEGRRREKDAAFCP